MAQYRFIIDDDNKTKDNSIAYLHPDSLVTLSLLRGDPIILNGNQGRDTLCRVIEDDRVKIGAVWVNQVVRNNLRMKLGDSVRILKIDLQPGKYIRVAPIEDSVEGITGSLSAHFLNPYFSDKLRPVKVGDTFRFHHLFYSVEFKVLETYPEEYCIVTPETEIREDFERIKREESDTLSEIGYEDIGGLSEQILQIRRMWENPIRNPGTIRYSTRGLLMIGPPGNGKEFLARAIANEMGVSFFQIDGRLPQRSLSPAGETEHNLRSVFEAAKAKSPSIIFINRLELIAPSGGQMGERIDSELLSLVDGIKARTQVKIIGSIENMYNLNSTFGRYGRLSADVIIRDPDDDARLETLQILTKHFKLEPSFDWSFLIAETSRFSSSAIVQLCTDACLECVKDRENIDETLSGEMLDSMQMTMDHFRRALYGIPLQ